jgi:hypothetical protein
VLTRSDATLKMLKTSWRTLSETQMIWDARET